MPGATWNFLQPGGYISDIAWIWAISMLAVIAIVVLATQALRLAPEWVPAAAGLVGSGAITRFALGPESGTVRTAAIAAAALITPAVVAFGMLPPIVYALTGRRAAAFVTTGVAAIGVVGVGVSRIVLAAHWPSDIIGGVVVGLVVLLVAELVLDHLPVRWVPVCRDCPLHRTWGLGSSTADT